jgi:hypothetical protein
MEEACFVDVDLDEHVRSEASASDTVGYHTSCFPATGIVMKISLMPVMGKLSEAHHLTAHIELEVPNLKSCFVLRRTQYLGTLYFVERAGLHVHSFKLSNESEATKLHHSAQGLVAV